MRAACAASPPSTLPSTANAPSAGRRSPSVFAIKVDQNYYLCLWIIEVFELPCPYQALLFWNHYYTFTHRSIASFKSAFKICLFSPGLRMLCMCAYSWVLLVVCVCVLHVHTRTHTHTHTHTHTLSLSLSHTHTQSLHHQSSFPHRHGQGHQRRVPHPPQSAPPPDEAYKPASHEPPTARNGLPEEVPVSTAAQDDPPPTSLQNESGLRDLQRVPGGGTVLRGHGHLPSGADVRGCRL